MPESDGVIDASDIADGVDMSIALPESTEAGDQVIVTVTDGAGNETNTTPVPDDWDGLARCHVQPMPSVKTVTIPLTSP